MQFCKLTAIIQFDRLDNVEGKLRELGVTAFTLTKVHGVGEYKNYFENEGINKHTRIEIYLPELRAAKVVEGIMETAHTGNEGDGIVAVSPVNDIYRIRTREKCHMDESC